MSVIGVDVSKYNSINDGKVIWNPSAAKKPISFVIQRASYGGFYGTQVVDELYDKLLQNVKKVPIRGAYHYYSSHSSWKAQADFFLNVVRDKGYHFYAVDYETSFNTLDKRTTAEFAQFVDYVKKQTGKKCLAYFNWNTYESIIKPNGFADWVNNNDVWFAWYPYQSTDLPRPNPTLPDGLKNWRIWQYGAGDVAQTAGYQVGFEYGGPNRGIDLNAYNGTIEAMIEWCGGEAVVPSVITDSEKLQRLWDAHPELH